MITLTVCLVSLSPQLSHSEFLSILRNFSITPIITARVIQWIVTPTFSPHLLSHTWDFLLIFQPPTIMLPQTLTSLVSKTFYVRLHVPETLLTNFATKNHDALHPKAVPELYNLDKPLIATSTQRVELTPALLAFARSELCPKGPVSMLNFVSFHPFVQAKMSYAAYIEAFNAGMGAKRGGEVKIMGETDGLGQWDEVVLAQYSSLEHFADMCADPEYQKTNLELRLPALRDTCILMTSEVNLAWEV